MSQIGVYFLKFRYYGVIVGMVDLGIAMRFTGDLLLGRKSTAISIFMATAIASCVVLGFEMNVGIAQFRTFFFIVPIVGLHFLVIALRNPCKTRPSC